MRVHQWMIAILVIGLSMWGLSAITRQYAAAKQEEKQAAATSDSKPPAAPPPEAETPAETESSDGEESVLEKKAKDKETVNSNPFDLTPTKGPKPKAVLTEKSFDFGRLAMGKSGKHEFTIRNEGNAPLKVAKGPTMCKCTLSSLAGKEIPPGEDLKVTVEWEPKSLGPFSQSAVVWTNDTENSRVEMLVTGMMYAEVNMSPENQWLLGLIPPNTPKEFEGILYSHIHENLEITEITASSPQVSFRFEETKSKDPELEDAKRAYRIIGTLAPTDIEGEVKESAVIRTNIPLYSEIKMNIIARCSGPVQMIGPGWQAGDHLLRLGRVKSAEGKTHRITLIVDDFGQDLQITDIKSELSFVSLELVKDKKTTSGAAKQFYSLLVKVAPDAPPGVWAADRRAKLVFHTNHPKVPQFDINLDFEVE